MIQYILLLIGSPSLWAHLGNLIPKTKAKSIHIYNLYLYKILRNFIYDLWIKLLLPNKELIIYIYMNQSKMREFTGKLRIVSWPQYFNAAKS